MNVELTVNSVPQVTTNGHRFSFAGHAQYAPFIYMAHNARNGDRVAIELLSLFNVSIPDLDGKSYWPMEIK